MADVPHKQIFLEFPLGPNKEHQPASQPAYIYIYIVGQIVVEMLLLENSLWVVMTIWLVSWCVPNIA